MPDYLQAKRCCDLVMKGGITSGILYPPAICRIAESFHLVGIGGTSAGAIASCVAAAAEYRRRHRNDGEGFELLEQLPHDLAGEGKLMGLFRPDKSTRKVYELLLDLATLQQRSWLGRKLLKARGLWALWRHEKRLKPLVENGFGLCTGMANGNPPGAGEIAPLTEWLADRIDAVAGKDDGVPLTFGDLWHAPVPPYLADTMSGDFCRSIDLRAVTTCVSFGRPYELPFDEHTFAFDVEEWKRLFPERVVAHLIREAERIPANETRRNGKLPLPVGTAMPIVVAARMSLSFPGLFTMVPLYAVNYNAPKGSDGQHPMMKVWFSDGGITSNLPIHRFDSIFPRWPTLGINLQYTDEEGRPARSTVDESLVYMIKRRSDGVLDLWNVFDGKESPLKNVMGFGGSIFRSAQTWHDNAFLRLPSYRDRIVEIWLKPDEGGMNLAMPPDTIKRLIERGNEAGIRLRERFANADPNESLSWDGHRWVRLRSALSGLAASLHGFKRSVDHPMPDDRTLQQLLATKDTPPTLGFDEEGQFAVAKQAINDLLDYVAKLDGAPVCRDDPNAGWLREADRKSPDRPFCSGPRPAVEIGSRAPI